MSAFPWTAVVGGAIGLGQGVASWLGGNAAADAENKGKRDRFIAERSSVFANTRAQDEANLLNYAWKIAETEGIRFQEAQEKADYEVAMSRLADNALANLRLNQQAINDQYITGENLRATQEVLGLNNTLDALALESRYRTEVAGNRLENEIAQAGNNAIFQVNQQRIETNDAVRNYINTIKDNASQARARSMRENRQLEQLIQGQVVDAQMDSLQRDISFAASLADRGKAMASGLGRGVSAKTANSLQMNSAKKLGRSYGELLLRQRKRKNSLATMNAAMQGEVAQELSRFALASTKALNDIGSAEERFKVGKQFEANRLERIGNFAINEARIQGNYAIDSARREGDFALDKFEKLTIPSFQLAANQGAREYESLFIETQNTLFESSVPFRESIIFDPQKPLPGLYSNVLPPTYTQGPSVGSGIVNTVISGVNGALQGRGVDSTGKGYWF